MHLLQTQNQPLIMRTFKITAGRIHLIQAILLNCAVYSFVEIPSEDIHVGRFLIGRGIYMYDQVIDNKGQPFA